MGRPLFKQIYIETNEEHFNWVEWVISKVDNDFGKDPRPKFSNCIKDQYNKKCDCLEYCPYGREIIDEPLSLNFNELDEIDFNNFYEED